MVYRLDAGTVIDAEGNLVIENLYTGSVVQASQIQGVTTGYSSGSGSPSANIIDKFPFSSDANATDVGNTTISKYWVTGNSSRVSGYVSGGNPPFTVNVIEKFPFAVEDNATDVGDLTTTGRQQAAGQSSQQNGYVSGGAPPSIDGTDVIDKFPFSTDANATDVGDLTQSRIDLAGQQI